MKAVYIFNYGLPMWQHYDEKGNVKPFNECWFYCLIVAQSAGDAERHFANHIKINPSLIPYSWKAHPFTIPLKKDINEGTIFTLSPKHYEKKFKRKESK